MHVTQQVGFFAFLPLGLAAREKLATRDCGIWIMSCDQSCTSSILLGF